MMKKETENNKKKDIKIKRKRGKKGSQERKKGVLHVCGCHRGGRREKRYVGYEYCRGGKDGGG